MRWPSVEHEIDFRYDKALATADKAVTFKYTLKAVAEEHGLFATFMPKPIFGVNGSGMHCHQSLFRAGTSENVFYDANDDYSLSELAKQFIAGQLAGARGMTPILASLVNSYKRLVPGSKAPVYISWARANRSALIRVPKISKGKERSARMGSVSPILPPIPTSRSPSCSKPGSTASSAGCPCRPPAKRTSITALPERLVETGVQQLPGSLDDALDALEADSVVQEALGRPALRPLPRGQTSRVVGVRNAGHAVGARPLPRDVLAHTNLRCR